VDDPELTRDGYRIATDGSTLFVTGGGSRGCLYGVYAFLHDLGCRWPYPGEAYEVVPELNTIRWTAGEVVSNPAVERRGISVILNDPNASLTSYIDFMAKNKFNFYFIHGGSLTGRARDELAEAMNRREMGFEFGGHLLPGFLPRELFEEHPEYFRMEDGERTKHLNMCPSSEGGADVMAKSALPYVNLLEPFDEAETLHLWADDLEKGGWCDCPLCENLTETDQTVLVLNKVGSRLPLGDLKLAFCAYHASIHPPENVETADFVRLMYAPRERCFHHALGECEINKRYLKYADDLIQALPNEPEVFEYYHDCIMFRHMSFPMHPIIGKDVEAYRSVNMHGIMSVGFQEFMDWAYGINTYVLAKALWRGSGEREDAVEYCQAMYGPGGDKMLEYFDQLNELVGTAMHTCGYPDHTDLRVPPVFEFAARHAGQLAPLASKEHLDRIESTLHQALAMTKGTKYYERIEHQQYAWEYTRHEVGVMKDTIIVGAKMYELEHGGLNEQERKATIATLDRLIENLAEGTEMINAVPGHLRGEDGPGGNVVGSTERKGLYLPTLKAYRDRLSREK
jgi:hypothetical protein